MKDKNKKYIIVDAKKIKITKHEVKRVAGFNDFWNEYVACGETTAAKIFKEHEIPDKFQKIAFNLPLLPWEHECKEVLTGRSFDLFKKKKENKYICDEQGRFYDGDTVPGALEFSVPIHKLPHEDVVSFYENLAEQGYLETYIEAMKKMFYVRNELYFNKEETKLENKATTLIKTNKKVS